MSKYVIIDSEMCRVTNPLKKAEYGGGTELIQIGAVLLSENYTTEDEFKTLIRPQYGTITSYIQELTGISSEDVKDAPTLKEALDAFLEWLPVDAVIVSWSDNDMTQLQRETSRKEIELPRLDKYYETWIDCQKTFAEKMDNDRCYRLSEALIFADIDYDEGAHDALVDAYNTARLFAKMQTEEKIITNKHFHFESEEAEHLNYKPFAGLMALISCAG